MQTIQQLIKQYSNDKSTDTYQKVIQALKEQETLWIACSPYTENCFLDFEDDRPAAYIFTEKAFYDNFQDYILQQKIQVTLIENNLSDRMTMFRDIFRSGFELLVINNGQHYLKLSLFDVIDKPEFFDVPEINKPIFNPSLLCAANNFFQHYAIKKATREMEYQFFKEIYSAKYLLVMDTSQCKTEKTNKATVECIDKENSVMFFPLITNVTNQHFYPFFTDWTELRKFDTEHKYSGIIVSFNDMKHFISHADGITINPFGVNIIITADMLKAIETVGIKTTETVNIKDQIGQKDTKVMFGELKNYLQ